MIFENMYLNRVLISQNKDPYALEMIFIIKMHRKWFLP